MHFHLLFQPPCRPGLFAAGVCSISRRDPYNTDFWIRQIPFAGWVSRAGFSGGFSQLVNPAPAVQRRLPAPKHPVYSTNPLAAVGRISDAGRGVLAACGPNLWYAGYMDWHVANGVVLVPILGDVNDERALAVIGEHFPGRDVIGIDGRTIMEGGGGFHCVTKPEAAAPA